MNTEKLLESKHLKKIEFIKSPVHVCVHVCVCVCVRAQEHACACRPEVILMGHSSVAIIAN